MLAERNEALGATTNNVAEYRGLIAGLQAAADLGADRCRRADGLQARRRADVRTLEGQARRAASRWRARRRRCASSFAEITFEWIPREQNKHADRLANEAMDLAAGKPPPARAPRPAADVPRGRRRRARRPG